MIETAIATVTAKYVISITDNMYLNYFDIIVITNIIDTGNTINIVTEKGDIFIDKKYCTISMDSNNNPQYISGITDNMEIYLEKYCNM